MKKRHLGKHQDLSIYIRDDIDFFMLNAKVNYSCGDMTMIQSPEHNMCVMMMSDVKIVYGPGIIAITSPTYRPGSNTNTAKIIASLRPATIKKKEMNTVTVILSDDINNGVINNGVINDIHLVPSDLYYIYTDKILYVESVYMKHAVYVRDYFICVMRLRV